MWKQDIEWQKCPFKRQERLYEMFSQRLFLNNLYSISVALWLDNYQISKYIVSKPIVCVLLVYVCIYVCVTPLSFSLFVCVCAQL